MIHTKREEEDPSFLSEKCKMLSDLLQPDGGGEA